jgi:hypothetical protein
MSMHRVTTPRKMPAHVILPGSRYYWSGEGEKEKIQGNYDGGRFGFEEFMVILREGGGAIVIIPTQGG